MAHRRSAGHSFEVLANISFIMHEHGLEFAAAGIGSSDPAFEAAGARVLTGWIAR